jgi:hypothetical protein
VEPTDQSWPTSWSTTVFSFEPLPETLRAVLNVQIGGLRISEQQGVTVSGSSASGINFAPASLTAGTWHNREVIDYFNDDSFLFVPGTSGEFNLAMENIGSGQMYPNMGIYNADTGYPVAFPSGPLNQNAADLNANLTAGHPYIVQVGGQLSGGGNTAAYRFRALPLTSRTISGTISFSNLSFNSVDNAVLWVYRADTLEPVMDIPVSSSGGAWSASISVPADLDLYFVLDVTLGNWLHVHSTDTRRITGNTTINFTPQSISAGTIYTGKAIGFEGQFFLFVPAQSGTYTLDAMRDTALDPDMDPLMELYDGANGMTLDYDDNGGGIHNSRITCTLEAGHPYIIQVRDNYNDGNGIFLLRVAPGTAPEITLSGILGLNYGDIDNAEVVIFSGGYSQSAAQYVAHSEVDLEDGTWSVTIPAFTNPTDLYLRFFAALNNSNGVEKNVLILTGVEDEDIPGIDLGTFTIANLSGTLSSVLIDDDPEPPSSVWIIATAGGEDVGSAEPDGGGAWNMDVVVPQGAGNVSFVIATGDGQSGFVVWQTNVSRTVTGNTTGIGLGDITILTTELLGTVKSGSQSIEADIFALPVQLDITDIRSILETSFSAGIISSKVVSTGWTDNGTWQLAIPATAPEYLWFVVISWQNGNIYITRAPQSTSAPVTLNINQMDLLGSY